MCIKMGILFPKLWYYDILLIQLVALFHANNHVPNLQSQNGSMTPKSTEVWLTLKEMTLLYFYTFLKYYHNLKQI
mgnify:FL=1